MKSSDDNEIIHREPPKKQLIKSQVVYVDFVDVFSYGAVLVRV
ncbi:MAG TPA: hypothetical protein VGN23_02050 [Verrucomicrobiae bacterium]